MDTLQVVVTLMFFAAILVGVARKLNIPYPIALVFGGALLGFMPGLPSITFDPNTVLLVVLPPILYYGAFGISFRDFSRNWKEIFSLAITLVVVTTLIVGMLFKWLLPQFPWPLAFAFGAIVSPPDAVAATAVLKRFKIGNRLSAVLEGESLVNDASALVLYRMAVLALLSGSFSIAEGSLEFLKVVTGGIGLGLALGSLIQRFSSQYLEPVVGVLFSFTIPYIVYIIADSLDVSGVLAVVVVGLIGSRFLISHRSPLRRVLGYVTWDIWVIVLNCLVFIMIGLQLRNITKVMTAEEIWRLFGYSVLVTFAIVAVRFLWIMGRFGVTYLKALYRPHADKICPEILREGVILAWSSMRGIVSLTAALALPLTLPGGEAIDGRDEVIFMTFNVILLTLVIPGLTLPFLIRALNVQSDREDEDTRRVSKQLSKVADDKLNKLHTTEAITQEEFDFLRTYFKLQRRLLGFTHSSPQMHNIDTARHQVIQEQRKHLLSMWKRREIGDQLLLLIEQQLDTEEAHIVRADLS